MRLKNKGIYIFNTLLVLYIIFAVVILAFLLNLKADFFEYIRAYSTLFEIYFISLVFLIMIDVIYMIFDSNPTRKRMLNIFNMASVILVLFISASLIYSYEYYVVLLYNGRFN